ncbi:hypothetical protein F3Y22_tig00110303pilonHSYRG00263 [Hibiscus syriacus]|uniref:Uncharacterized protein n=1 Tax=Hibiscus syriacus TaxID=106335 RepID=A0A6A3B776_HIBSY|nr:hypothetical protein F3Y22_tig00110303pilonHSYRG00263 [Hibiscus syriacus]
MPSNPCLSRSSFGTHASCKTMASSGYMLANCAFSKSRRMGLRFPHASGEDGVTFNGTSQTSISTDLDGIRTKLNQSLEGEDYPWIGVDRNAWVKTFSYQAAVYSLLQATIEIASRGDSRDRNTYVFVQRRREMVESRPVSGAGLVNVKESDSFDKDVIAFACKVLE